MYADIYRPVNHSVEIASFIGKCNVVKQQLIMNDNVPITIELGHFSVFQIFPNYRRKYYYSKSKIDRVVPSPLNSIVERNSLLLACCSPFHRNAVLPAISSRICGRDISVSMLFPFHWNRELINKLFEEGEQEMMGRMQTT